MHRNHLLVVFLAALINGSAPGPLLAKDGAADADASKSAIPGKDGFDCGGGKPGWKRAQAVTPNLVPPCNTGSGGKCEGPRFEYVAGTGWCRPRQ